MATPPLILSISISPQQGRVPLLVTITGNSNNPITVWNWYINNVIQVETSQQVIKTFSQKGTYAIKLIASDIYGHDSVIVCGSVYAVSGMSTTDIALEDMNVNRIMTFVGSADVVYSRPGLGIKVPAYTSSFQNAGFTHNNGPNIIFS